VNQVVIACLQLEGLSFFNALLHLTGMPAHACFAFQREQETGRLAEERFIE
jgi:hypothetical protein